MLEKSKLDSCTADPVPRANWHKKKNKIAFPFGIGQGKILLFSSLHLPLFSRKSYPSLVEKEKESLLADVAPSFSRHLLSLFALFTCSVSQRRCT